MTPVAVFDLDGTLTRRDTFVGFWFALLRLRPWRAVLCAHLPICLVLARLGFIRNDWLKELFLTAAGKGLTRAAVSLAGEKFAQQVVATGLRQMTQEKLQLARKDGRRIVLATASLDIYVNAIAARLGIAREDVVCTQAQFSQVGLLTGCLEGENCYGEAKARHLTRWMEANQTAFILNAFTDHHSDVPLLQLAQKPVAVHPDSRLMDYANRHAIQVEFWERAA